MESLKIVWLVSGTLAVAFLAVVMLVYVRYWRDIRVAEERLLKGGSRVVETECGPIEFAVFGEGYPVLVIHGIFGGFDQGLMTAHGNLTEGFRAVVPSRFGYLRTPLPGDASPAGQADAYACLLDKLGVGKAAIMATSAGGTSAIQFALRHPDRCSAMVLVSSNAPGETKASLPPRPLARVIFRSDFIFWLLVTRFRSRMKSMMGVPKGLKLTPEYEADLVEAMKIILPVSPRSEGAIFDMYFSNPFINSGCPLEKITVPTLIINALDDPLALYENARSMAEMIPGAKLLTIESGGHMLLGHGERIGSEIVTFLREHAEL